MALLFIILDLLKVVEKTTYSPNGGFNGGLIGILPW